MMIHALSVDGLVNKFYESFEDLEQFRGTDETRFVALEIVDRGDAMWNWPSVVEDAEAFLAQFN